MGSVGNRPNTSSNITYSNVDTRSTPMSDDDVRRLSSWGTGYFQTSNSFTINEALRILATDNDITDIRSALKRVDWWASDTDIDKTMQTIDVMDKNMRPIDKELSVVRLADRDYAESLFNQLEVSEWAMDAVHDMRFFGLANSDNVLSELRSKLIGAEITEAGYMSTTYNKSLSDSAFADREIQLNIEAKPGTRGMFSPTGNESEFVFARGTGYTITGVDYDKDERKLVISVQI